MRPINITILFCLLPSHVHYFCHFITISVTYRFVIEPLASLKTHEAWTELVAEVFTIWKFTFTFVFTELYSPKSQKEESFHCQKSLHAFPITKMLMMNTRWVLCMFTDINFHFLQEVAQVCAADLEWMNMVLLSALHPHWKMFMEMESA